MMENAGRTLAQAAVEYLGAEWRDRPIVVCAGSGGNGGGGICAARHLANHGGDVVLILPVSDRMTSVAEQQLQIFRKTPGRIGATESAEAELILDALIGYGLKGAPGGANQDAIRWITENDAPVISLDVPSGLDSTTGKAPGDAIEATTTLALALPKTGLLSPLAGDLFLADIGIPVGVLAMAGIRLDRSIFMGRHRIHLNRRLDV
jgi:NAD(P)H-hydrate epimerase